MMNDMEKILQLLKSLREDVTAIKTNVTALQGDVTAVKNTQQSQGKRLTALEAGQIALDLKSRSRPHLPATSPHRDYGAPD
jgi:hypothetical protein